MPTPSVELRNVRKLRTIVRDMRTNNPGELIRSLLPRVKTAVLAKLLLSDREWYPRELARELDMSLSTVSKELARLKRSGIAKSRRSGRQLLYSANQSCPIYDELRGLMAKTAGLADILRDALKPLALRISAAYIYGSMADGSANSQSDVDVMVVGEATLGDVVAVLGDAEQKLGREVNVTVYSLAEYKGKLALGRGFVHKVHNGKVIMLVGDTHELS